MPGGAHNYKIVHIAQTRIENYKENVEDPEAFKKKVYDFFIRNIKKPDEVNETSFQDILKIYSEILYYLCEYGHSTVQDIFQKIEKSLSSHLEENNIHPTPYKSPLKLHLHTIYPKCTEEMLKPLHYQQAFKNTAAQLLAPYGINLIKDGFFGVYYLGIVPNTVAENTLKKGNLFSDLPIIPDTDSYLHGKISHIIQEILIADLAERVQEKMIKEGTITAKIPHQDLLTANTWTLRVFRDGDPLWNFLRERGAKLSIAEIGIKDSSLCDPFFIMRYLMDQKQNDKWPILSQLATHNFMKSMSRVISITDPETSSKEKVGYPHVNQETVNYINKEGFFARKAPPFDSSLDFKNKYFVIETRTKEYVIAWKILSVDIHEKIDQFRKMVQNKAAISELKTMLTEAPEMLQMAFLEGRSDELPALFHALHCHTDDTSPYLKELILLLIEHGAKLENTKVFEKEHPQLLKRLDYFTSQHVDCALKR